MQFAPAAIDQNEVIQVLQQIDQISSVHHIHLWQLSDHNIYFEAHLVLRNNYPVSDTQSVTENAQQLLKSHFGITHTTFQYEFFSCKETAF